MKLSQQDAEWYFMLMWALQYFVKERLQELPDITTLQEYMACSPDENLQVRQALFEQGELIQSGVVVWCG